MTTLLGLPLEEAVRRLRQAGIEPVVRVTASPRGAQEGTLRVIRAREEGRELTAARFDDAAASRGESDDNGQG